jgi:3-oxo-4-pregnene-20-carboxyl-CoA dehydrogenase alpha subunit
VDFELSEAQRVIAASAADVLKGAGDSPWPALAGAGLLALTLPGWLDGDDLGVLDAAVLLTEIGRAAALVPALATIMLGALPVTRWGSKRQQELLLAGVGTGASILTAGIREQSEPRPAVPATVATLIGEDSGTVTGTKVGVPYAAQARWLLIPAAVAGGGRALVVVDPVAVGVTITPTPTSGNSPEATVRLDAASITSVLRAGQEPRTDPVEDLYQLATAAAAAQADGALAGALDLTSGYIAQRHQFGKPLATFQAVAQQIADVYIASRTLHLAALSANWRLAAGLDATGDVDLAAFWLAQEGPPALRTCHHLHGGIGVDVEYPMHRYSSMINDLTRFVGGADYCLEALTTGSANVH